MSDTTIIDPLGRSITLHARTWFGHVVERRPDLEDRYEEVAAVIERPNLICVSNSGDRIRLYYGDADSSGKMLVVVADVVEVPGFVKTVYPTRTIKKGEIEWQSPM
jgi:hypothetical protein